VIQNEEGLRHLKYSMLTKTVCPTNASELVKTTFEIQCNPEGKRTDPLTDLKIDDADQCNILVTGSHAAGCPVFQATSFVEFLTNHPWIMGFILLVFGCVVTFFGGKWYPHVLATIVGGLTFLIVMLFASAFGALTALEAKSVKNGKQVGIAVAAFLIALALALFAGWFIKKVRRVGLGLLGGAAGLFLGFTLYNMLFAMWVKHVAVLVLSTVGFAALGCFAAYKWDKVIIVYVTAFIGSYALIRGISVFAGSYPNEISMFTQMMAGVFDLSPAFYGYLAGFAALTVVGVIFQTKMKYDEHKEENDGYSKV
jgi:hypothetical protein